MFVFLQILLGSLILILCTLTHIALAAKIVRVLRDERSMLRRVTGYRTFLVLSCVVLALLLSHTAHIYVWAISLWILGALSGYEEPIYFSLVTYTTVGYGDVTLPNDLRIFGAMASVNGILAFGVTTAFLVGLFTSALEDWKDT